MNPQQQLQYMMSKGMMPMPMSMPPNMFMQKKDE
jgi:hypothetical protein